MHDTTRYDETFERRGSEEGQNEETTRYEKPNQRLQAQDPTPISPDGRHETKELTSEENEELMDGEVENGYGYEEEAEENEEDGA